MFQWLYNNNICSFLASDNNKKEEIKNSPALEAAEETVLQLINMGFSPEDSVRAINESGCTDLHSCVNYILSLGMYTLSRALLIVVKSGQFPI